MHRNRSSAFAVLLMVLTVGPWLLTGCYEQLLIPPELKTLRAEYEATAAAFRESGLQEMRDAPSGRNVVVLGTVEPEFAPAVSPSLSLTATTGTLSPRPSTSAAASATSTGSAAPSPSITPTPSATLGAVARVTVLTVTPNSSSSTSGPSPTPRGIVVQPKKDVLTTPRPSSTARPANTARPATTLQTSDPPTRRQVVDRITEQMLGDQVRREVTQTTIRNLTIELTPDGFTASGHISLLLGIQRALTIRGVFAVEHESLVGKVSSIRFAGGDVTEEYRNQLEDRINWSLYQLLPQRYVRSYQLSHDAITVTSEMKR